MSNNRITVRSVRPSDEAAVRRLEQLDSAEPLGGRRLIAELDRVPVAAYSLEERRSVADPFRQSAAAAGMLEARAKQLLPARTGFWRSIGSVRALPGMVEAEHRGRLGAR